MRIYFEQFGEIIEAVVITDKNSGRSKGYGFVTFKDADAAMRACQNPSPLIDGRRANCNLASLGAKNINTSHQYGIGHYRSPPAYYGSSSSSSSSLYYYYPQYTFPYSTAAYIGYNNAGYTQDTTMGSPMYGTGSQPAYYYNNITINPGGGVYSNMYQPPLIYSNEHAQQPHHHHPRSTNYGVFHNYPQMFHYPPPYFQTLPSSSSLLPITTTTTASPDSTTETQNSAGVAANITVTEPNTRT